LTFGGFEPVLSVENEAIAKPVPDKVMDDMRSCGAAIIHVGTDKKLLDEEGNEHRTVNPNVLIEIGAAMALYGGRFILLVESGVILPSNLQGLYEARYERGKLDYDATMKLLKAFNDFRT
jgi:predicted nucleotide-binding protein